MSHRRRPGQVATLFENPEKAQDANLNGRTFKVGEVFSGEQHMFSAIISKLRVALSPFLGGSPIRISVEDRTEHCCLFVPTPPPPGPVLAPRSESFFCVTPVSIVTSRLLVFCVTLVAHQSESCSFSSCFLKTSFEI